MCVAIQNLLLVWLGSVREFSFLKFDPNKNAVEELIYGPLPPLILVLLRTKVPEHHFCAVKLLGWQQQRGERREVL